MYGSKQISLKAQRGVTLTGLIVVMGMIIAVAMVALKVIPSVIEYKAIKGAIHAAKATNGTPAEIRSTFSKHAEINNITTIDAKDLMISKVNGETEVAFDYNQRIPLFTDVALEIHYAATTDKSGVIPEKSETPK